MEVTGRLSIPLLTMHTTGDGQVPINQAQILQRRAHAAGRDRLLVQRVVEDPGHCGFSTAEQENGFRSLVDWVENGRRPSGTSLQHADLRRLDRTFELEPRTGTAAADRRPAARSRVTVQGTARRDGVTFDTQWIGAVVVDHGLVTACNVTLPPVRAGRFSISIFGANESIGCGRRGTEIVLWTYLGSQQLYATTAIPWPSTGSVRTAVNFATATPWGAAPMNVGFSGEVYHADGRRVRTGARVEAYIDNTRVGSRARGPGRSADTYSASSGLIPSSDVATESRSRFASTGNPLSNPARTHRANRASSTSPCRSGAGPDGRMAKRGQGNHGRRASDGDVREIERRIAAALD